MAVVTFGILQATVCGFLIGDSIGRAGRGTLSLHLVTGSWSVCNFSCFVALYRSMTLRSASLVPSLSAPQIFIAYSMKSRGGKSGRKRHDDAC